MPIGSYLLGTGWDPILVQPPLRLELFGVRAPYAHRAVYSADRNRDELTCCDGDAIYSVIVGRLERDAEWDYVIIHGLEKNKNR
jgi:hypothetical protein